MCATSSTHRSVTVMFSLRTGLEHDEDVEDWVETIGHISEHPGEDEDDRPPKGHIKFATYFWKSKALESKASGNDSFRKADIEDATEHYVSALNA